MEDAAEVMSVWLPVVLGHAAITHKGCKHVAQVIACHNDGYPLYPVILPPSLVNADTRGVITDVHQCADNNLVIHSDLQAS